MHLGCLLACTASLSSVPPALQGEMKLQIDRMIAKFFAGLPNDEQLNFSVAVTVMKVQRKWRARMRTLRVSFCTFMNDELKHVQSVPFRGKVVRSLALFS